MIGNWKTHILVKCAICLKLMGYHKESTTAVCNTCRDKRKDSMTILTKDVYKRGDQTTVFNKNSQKWQVQTWTGSRWYGFVDVRESHIGFEKQRQLRELPNENT